MVTRILSVSLLTRLGPMLSKSVINGRSDLSRSVENTPRMKKLEKTSGMDVRINVLGPTSKTAVVLRQR
ncbi:hypothetical protein F442_08786 [Phytophthora nicotianae P10297]|uniref:Uncharacterized protein n=1 Tax=Phytophthora nicotianae P10297 TaxID=1317064 RepID=W2ZEP6_PHYNI|nr:hypothetical protein F442_08786 [Phytophthora nicotianae P10297]